MPTITLVGLGPGDPMLLTRAAWDCLCQATVIATPDMQHPALAGLAARLEPLPAGPELPAALADLAAQAQTHNRDYCCALRGVQAHHPAVQALAAATARQGGALRLLPDLPHELEPLPTPATQANPVRSWAAEQGDTPYVAPLVPIAPLHDRRSFETLRWVVARLLGPGGCPWDVQQRHADLRGNLLEETYEALEALDDNDMSALADELGDVLMQVLAHSEMARQAGHFALGDVVASITNKLIRRHPHVFGTLDVDSTGAVLDNWEAIKAHELRAQGKARVSALDGVPRALPALAAAQKIGAKAARVGFDWPTLARIWDKLDEEQAEVREAAARHASTPNLAHRAALEDELGDLLYATVQVGRWLNLDAESALRQATAKFRRRFQYVEQAARAQGRRIDELSDEESQALWQAAKAATHQEAR